jgi:Plasmid pRiA4b ORF-3-like protein
MSFERIEHLAEEEMREDALWIMPRCLAGAWACPPEDAGGIGGYALLLEALQDPKHPEHQHLRRWAGISYDPELFSVQQTNSALANLDCAHRSRRL